MTVQMRCRWTIPLFSAALLLVSCGQTTHMQPRIGPQVAAAVHSEPLQARAQCTGAFVTHELDHRTTVAKQPINQFVGNGSGVAVGDLDGDGLPEIVLANLDGPNTILWNQSHMQFRTERLAAGDSRGVAAVDVDGDGLLDLVFTRRHSGPLYLHNAGGQHLIATPFATEVPLYSMNWADLNGDGTLDLVGATYDAELEQLQGMQFYANHDGGVYVYSQRNGQFAQQRLSDQAQALAIALPDVNGDGRPDIVVGNDFAMRDGAWLRTDTGWTAATPFATTSENTMSFDQGDVDNTGQLALFATDMKPYDKSVGTLAQWLPMMKKMAQPASSNDPQIVENVLQVRDASGAYHNEGYSRKIDATGWSWSGRFGDFDNDGYLDLYIVNGMISHGLFAHLPNDTLVEQHQVFRNTGNRQFEPAPQWNLGATESGRGMVVADLNGDGTLDIVVNNLESAAQLFENRLCGGNAVEVDLRWAGSANTRGIGARLALETSAGTYTRDVRVASGYLSGDMPQVHFGVPTNATVQRLVITWPDGATSAVDQPAVQQHLVVTR